MYTAENNSLLSFLGTNTSDMRYEVKNIYYEKLIPDFDVSALAAEGGTWLQARQYYDDFYDVRYRVLTYLLPFTTAMGSIAIAGVDVSLVSLATAVTVTTANAEVIVTDTKYNASLGGSFVVDTFDMSLFWASPYAATDTPSLRVNEIAAPIVAKSTSMTSLNFSFYTDGLIYQSLSMLDRYWLMARSPLALSAGEIEASFGELLDLYEHLTAVTASAFTECETSANNRADNTFIESIAQIERVFGTRVRSLYVAYLLQETMPTTTTTTTTTTAPTTTTTTTTTTTSPVSSSADSGEETPNEARTTTYRRTANLLDTTAEKWGGCGCSYDKDTDAYVCFYTNSDSVELIFNDAVPSNSEVNSSVDFTGTRRYQFMQDQVVNLTAATSAFWTAPYFAYDGITKTDIVAMSYVLPFKYDSEGNVTAAAVFDLALDWVPTFLAENTPSGTTGLFLIDRRNSGTFMGSRSVKATSVYGAMDTSNATINKFTTAVYERVGSFNASISFHLDTDLVNYQLIDPYWGVLEIIPASVALKRYLPTPTVTSATDALRLIPTSETIVLFLYVGGILFAFFLNLLILGCSKLGEAE
ncbi:hypothetical protein STCU_06006 [Strigomonas culicis]|uniref:Uncharacterized protein n=1 Tax=Strigomonas culicis TaxID=28005 RepID=S9U861_9TRYP|nr:hypothetical protein STCU_06006 [Strigomonas culicis]|eukprot:EPY26932.1 hypothetical protein STCU_06006 [Strigomonas culicis]